MAHGMFHAAPNDAFAYDDASVVPIVHPIAYLDHRTIKGQRAVVAYILHLGTAATVVLGGAHGRRCSPGTVLHLLLHLVVYHKAGHLSAIMLATMDDYRICARREGCCRCFGCVANDWAAIDS